MALRDAKLGMRSPPDNEQLINSPERPFAYVTRLASERIIKSNRGSVDPFAADDDAEIPDVLAYIKAANREGWLNEPPRKAREIKTLKDLCRYVFKLLHVSGRYQMRIDEGHVRVWVWCGLDFDDRLVGIIDRILPRVPGSVDLRELRLVATKVSDAGRERLNRMFPSARITVFTRQDDERNWRWAQAYYSGQDGDEWEAEAKEKVAIRPVEEHEKVNDTKESK